MTIENRRHFLMAATGALAALSAGLLGGCNTVEGVGQDIENAGDAIGDKARKEKRRN
jgi:predicted small secreted protein